MDLEALRAERLRAHRLSAPAASVVEAARHMTATQAQEFWGGRWALAVRAEGDPTLAEVDAAFDRGALVRSWTQRGTVHIIESRDLEWMLSVTSDRQNRHAAGMHRSLALDDDHLARAEGVARAALAGGNRLTRAEFADILAAAGIDPSGMRGNHVLTALCRRAVCVLGPVVPREGAPTREQYVVATEEWITDAVRPPDPLAEFFVRYLRGHGPARLEDFRWWAGVPLGLARDTRAGAGDRVEEIEEGLFVESGGVSSGPVEPGSALTGVLALGPFDEYYLSYADRTVPASPDVVRLVGRARTGP